LVCFIYRLQKKKVIFHFHELMVPWTPYSSALKFASLLIVNFLHNTQYSRQVTMEVNRFLEGKNNHVIPPIILARESGNGDTELESFAAKRNIVFIGQVSPHKGIDLLIETFERIAADREDTVLHIVGGCSEAYQEEFHGRIESLQQKGRIRYWGFRDDAHSFLKIATVFVQPTRPSVCHESFGRGVVEAMMMGIPSVCFRSGALQELVIDEQTGLICEEENATCLVQAIRRFLEDPAFRNQCAKNARRNYEEKYSPDIVKQKWLQLLEDWID
jgi:glycosyltransferase involved in cell wall biosynthesis